VHGIQLGAASHIGDAEIAQLPGRRRNQALGRVGKGFPAPARNLRRSATPRSRRRKRLTSTVKIRSACRTEAGYPCWRWRPVQAVSLEQGWERPWLRTIRQPGSRWMPEPCLRCLKSPSFHLVERLAGSVAGNSHLHANQQRFGKLTTFIKRRLFANFILQKRQIEV
jgi:hypothetical protein